MQINPVFVGIISEEPEGTFEYSIEDIANVEFRVIPGYMLHQNATQIIITLEPEAAITKEYLEGYLDDE